MQLRPRKSLSTISKKAKPNQRKNLGRKSVKSMPLRQIEEACSADVVEGPDKLTFAKMRSCEVKLNKIICTKELRSKVTKARVSQDDSSDPIEVFFKISKNKGVVLDSKDDALLEQMTDMTIEISSTKPKLAEKILSSASITEEMVQIESSGISSSNNGTVEGTDPVLRRSGRNRAIKKVIIQNEDVPGRNKKQILTLTPIQRANILWCELTSNDYALSVGSIVCAKMNGFWPWPAQIVCFQNKKRLQVKFFGDLKRGSIDYKQCVPYVECGTLFHLYIEAIPPTKREDYFQALHKEYNEITRAGFLRNFNRHALYMQAIEDISLYLDMKRSILRDMLSTISST